MREYKTLQFKTDDYDEEQGIFSGYAAVYGNVDSGNDVIEPGAFTKMLESGWERVVILALHNDQLLPVGKPLELSEDKHGLFIKAQIIDTTMGLDIRKLLKHRILKELSIGYEPVPGGFDIDEHGIRHLRELELWEVSVVTWAMNPAAKIRDYKAANGNAVDNIATLAQQITAEVKAGRKISGARLENLVTARDSMKGAVDVLNTVIRDARDDEAKAKKSRVSLYYPIQRKNRPTKQIEILLTGGNQ